MTNNAYVGMTGRCYRCSSRGMTGREHVGVTGGGQVIVTNNANVGMTGRGCRNKVRMTTMQPVLCFLK